MSQNLPVLDVWCRSALTHGRNPLKRPQIVLALTTTAIAVIAGLFTGCTPAPPLPIGTGSPSQAAVTVSVLSDSHAAAVGSWFRQTVEADRVPGARLGVFAAYPGATAAALEAKLDEAVAEKGSVIVQAGTNDLAAAAGPDATATNVKKLLAGVKARGASPILALIPPSATRGAEVKETNRLLSGYAADAGIGVLDLTSVVAGPAGQWRDGLSDDGVHANAAGSRIMAAAAAEQLPRLIR